nr:ABC transporter ATP-binding protein [uncultured Erwinia sp.]
MKKPVAGLTGPLLPSLLQNGVIHLLIVACYGAQAWLTADALCLLMQQGLAADVTPPLVMMAAIILLRALLLWLSEYTAQRIALACKVNLRERLLNQLVRFGPGLTLLHPGSDIQGAVNGGVEALEGYYSRYLPALFSALFGCSLIVLMLAVVDWPSALLLGIFTLAFPLIDGLWMRWQMPKASGVFTAMGAFAAQLLDALQGLLTLKAFGAAAAWRERLAARASDLRQASMATLKVILMRGGITRLVSLSGIALVLVFNAWRVVHHDLLPFVLLLTLFLTREAFRPLIRLENAFHTAWAAGGAVGPINDLLTLTAPVAEPANPQASPLHHDIRIDRLSFRYPQGNLALSDVSLTVAEGQFVALVGPSGAGKSTLVTLLLRCFDAEQGSIHIGGVDIRQLSLQALRETIGVVSQEVFLFHGTLADNLRIARPDASDDELAEAAAAAQLSELIAGLPLGMATPVGERGANLSGGQRQRVAIARALLKDAPILILDEATSGLDAASERALREALAALRRRRTTIAIAHRLETIQDADRILVFDHGELVEQGNHHQLSAAGGRYAQLMAAQGEAP